MMMTMMMIPLYVTRICSNVDYFSHLSLHSDVTEETTSTSEIRAEAAEELR